MKLRILGIAACILTPNLTFAEDSRHSIGVCPIAVPAYNLYAVNYEYISRNKDGVNIRVDYAPLTSNNIDILDRAILLNYRKYFSQSRHSLFAGIYTRYRENTGSIENANNAFQYESTEKTIGLNVGKRWTWLNGINAVVIVGYGVSRFDETAPSANQQTNKKIKDFQQDNDLFFDNPFYGEFSIGYTF